MTFFVRIMKQSTLKIGDELGFSYVDVMIAIVILMVGVLAAVSALSANLIRSLETEKRIIAKQLALSTIESVFSAREIKRPGVIDGWNSVRNYDPNDAGGIFLTDFRPIREDLGWDGVAGTADDACTGDGACTVPGRPSNTSPVIKGLQRRIVISNIQDPDRPSPPNPYTRRKIEVTIKFYVNQAVREEKITTLITDYQ